jgi:hypothetical protein
MSSIDMPAAFSGAHHADEHDRAIADKLLQHFALMVPSGATSGAVA